MDEIAWGRVLLSTAALVAGYGAGLYLGVLLHELGHAAAALLVASFPVELEVGRDPRARRFKCGRLAISLGFKGFRYGFTRYPREAVGRGRQAIVAASGPLASAAACAAALAILAQAGSGTWVWVLALAVFVANLRILVVALWPIAYRPDGAEGEVWLSDALDLWQLWRGDTKAKHRH